jgi:large subunit ribosomal protein L18
MILKTSKNALRQVRHKRIRKTLTGTALRPRLSVYRSNTAMYVQVINDEVGQTLVSGSTAQLKVGKTIEDAATLGTDIAKKALAAGITTVVFDRSGYLYHGRVKALADAARAAGLVF